MFLKLMGALTAKKRIGEIFPSIPHENSLAPGWTIPHWWQDG